MTTAREILEDLKARDHEDQQEKAAEGHVKNVGVPALLDGSKALVRLVAAWPNVVVNPDPSPEDSVPPDTPVSHYIRWLWGRLEPDPIPTWLAAAGLPDAPHIRKWCYVAIDNRIVFPDGTLSVWARRFLSAKAIDLLA